MLELLRRGFRVAAVATAVMLSAPVATAMADGSGDEIVEQAKWTVEKFLADRDYRALHRDIGRARAVLIVPGLIKAGFIFGAEFGNAVLLSRDDTGKWSYPAFYTMGAGSLGLQVGVESSEVIFLIMNQEGLEAVINHQVKLGADLSIAVGPMGTGAEASTTTNLGADIISYSKAVGLFGGVAFEGAVIGSRSSMNEEYYGRPVSPKTIVIDQLAQNPQADGLREALNLR
jgi:lipid-binding SYLF domain-containing protein